MSEHLSGESGEELVDETGRNATQQRMDEEGVEDVPVDITWSEDDGGDEGAVPS